MSQIPSVHNIQLMHFTLSRVHTNYTSLIGNYICSVHFHCAFCMSNVLLVLTWMHLDDDLVQLQCDVMSDLLERHCPVVTMRCRARPMTSWFDAAPHRARYRRNIGDDCADDARMLIDRIERRS